MKSQIYETVKGSIIINLTFCFSIIGLLYFGLFYPSFDTSNIILWKKFEIMSWTIFSAAIIKSLLMVYLVYNSKKSFFNIENKMNTETVSLLSENIHHELKTPLVVIANLVEDIRNKFDTMNNEIKKQVEYNNLNSKDKCIIDILGINPDNCSTSKELDVIDTHINVIYNLLDRMSNLKTTKYNNNNSLYDIIDISFKTLEIFNKNTFEYSVDHRLMGYKLKDIMSNEDIINIFINHIKNSLEAKSTVIEVHFIDFIDDILFIQIMDNGFGIPENVKNNIYNNNFSTKSNNIARGVGLYLCKSTLEYNGGGDMLIDSDKNGTSFGINIPAEIKIN